MQEIIFALLFATSNAQPLVEPPTPPEALIWDVDLLQIQNLAVHLAAQNESHIEQEE
jgi:hypothetical protein